MAFEYVNGQWVDPLTGEVDTSGASGWQGFIDTLLGGNGTTKQVAMGTGIASILDKLMNPSGGAYAGYRGGIPNLQGTRTMNAIPQTVMAPEQAAIPASNGVPAQAAVPAHAVPRRPGSGGITYFSPMVYSPAANNPGITYPATTANQEGGFAAGGIASLGGYSDGGRLLRGPGDGVSDSIPAMIGNKQQARLADGEFVVPARIVSEIGNGSTEAGARKLYAMMDRVQKGRKKTLKNVAANTKADKYLPA
jgi:hypothetical protein